MTDHEWLESLQPGDTVCIVGHGYGSVPRQMDTVERLTKTLVILTGGGRFSVKTGTVPGRSWNRDSIREWTSNDDDWHERRMLSERLKRSVKVILNHVEIIPVERFQDVAGEVIALAEEIRDGMGNV